jgi:hypothetical protein
MLYIFIWMLHMLQWLYTYVASIYSKCFTYFRHMLQVFYMLQVLPISDICCKCFICCKYIFQMFYLFQTYVASVLSRCCICCSGYTHMLQAYVSIISHDFGMLQQVLLPRTLTRGHARVTRTHPALFISVIKVNSNSRTCTQLAVSSQMVEHSRVKAHGRMQSARAG